MGDTQGTGDNVIVLPGQGETSQADGPPRSLRAALAESHALPPKLSARTGLSVMQLAGLACLPFLLAAALHFAPVETGLTLKFLFWFTFLLVILWRFVLVVVGAVHRFGNKPAPLEAQPDDVLPVYSILVPLRHEACMMEQLSDNLAALDWPVDKLDIILLIEEDDEATREAAYGAYFPDGTRLLTVPAGGPLTKPRALNYGLAHAEGTFVTVYDAEDRPHPRQLRAAFDLFSRSSADLNCVQAPLVPNNASASWIAANWSLEYNVQFGLNVPALARMRLPVLLGGTSNHFRRSDLVAFGGWDAWNVTEDADLGVRLSRLGGMTETIDYPTQEAAPECFGVWFRQRSRWIKGFLQTWAVSMRAPFSLLREFGLWRWFSLQLTLGGAVLSAFLYGPMSGLVMAGLVIPAIEVELTSFILFGFGWLTGAIAETLAPGRWTFSRCLAMLTRPLYWPLQTFAAVKAVYGLAAGPAFWAKTPHRPDEPNASAPWQTGSQP